MEQAGTKWWETVAMEKLSKSGPMCTLPPKQMGWLDVNYGCAHYRIEDMLEHC